MPPTSSASPAAFGASRWTPHELDAAIKLLGRLLRRSMAKGDGE